MVMNHFRFPKDWVSKTLYELSDRGFQNGLFYEVERKGKGIPIINVGDLYGSIPILNDDLSLFNATPAEMSIFAVQSGDIFFTRSSIVPSGIAMCNVYLSTTDASVVFDSHVIKYSVDKTQANPLFLTLQCRMPYAKQQLIGCAKTATMTTIDQKGIGNCSIFLPSLPEQKAIAETLTVFDTHIANLTELIEKKKAIRESALEDLISGKTRLSGFNSEWINISFDEYFTLLSNNTYSRDKLAEHGQVGNIHYGDILIKYSEIVTDEDEIPFLRPEITYSDNWLLHTNDVIIADTAEDETVGKAIQICEVSVPLVGGLHTIVCRPKFETAHGFLGLYINSKSYHDQLLPHITGIKVSSISKKAIKTTVLTIPSEIEEQSAIVGIITAMDEIVNNT